MSQKLRIAFMGSPEFAVSVVAALKEAGHDLVCVYSQPPRPAGRGKKLRPTPVHQWADAQGIEVRTPKSLKGEAAQAEFAALNLDAAVVVAYGLILPQAVLDAPKHGCMNMHASLLPRWRGAAPIHRAVMAGDTETGVQAMMMEAGLDTGPVLATAKTPIYASDTTQSVHDRLADLAAELAVTALSGLADGSITPQAQVEDGVIYAHKITAEDQRIDWSRPAAEVDCHIRGLSPFPGAWFLYEPMGEEPLRMKALMSVVDASPKPDAAVGIVLDDALLIACGDGKAVRLLRAQKPGSKAMDAEILLRGLPIAAGETLT